MFGIYANAFMTATRTGGTPPRSRPSPRPAETTSR